MVSSQSSSRTERNAIATLVLLICRKLSSTSLSWKRMPCAKRNCCSRTRFTTERWKTYCWDWKTNPIGARMRYGEVNAEGSIAIGSRERWRKWRYRIDRCKLFQSDALEQCKSCIIYKNKLFFFCACVVGYIVIISFSCRTFCILFEAIVSDVP